MTMYAWGYATPILLLLIAGIVIFLIGFKAVQKSKSIEDTGGELLSEDRAKGYRFIYLGIGVTVFALTVYFLQGLPDDPRGISHGNPVVFRSPEGRFSIQFPETPAYQLQRVPIPNGFGENHWYSVDQDQFHCAVCYGNYTLNMVDPAVQNRVLNAMQEIGVRNAKGKLLESRPITQGKYAGRDFHYIDNSARMIHARIYLTGNHYYYMLLAWPDEGKEGSAKGLKFLNSFQITQ